MMNQDREDAGGPILLFDGHCGLCNGLVRFLLRHDPGGRLRFAALESPAGQAMLAGHPEAAGVDSVVFLGGAGGPRGGGVVDLRSDAVLGVLACLGFPWSLFSASRVVPRPFRDAVYDWVARNRGRWFRRYDHCPLPLPGYQDRFLPL
jgi:predicted DCC family thiol-disulfide oxidoreductase YuxK